MGATEDGARGRAARPDGTDYVSPSPPKKRLPPEIFELPVEKMREGYYTDAYFNHARATLLDDGGELLAVNIIEDVTSSR